MFWILGAEEIVHALSHASQSGWSRFLALQLSHKDWEGVAFYDLIFPLFVFMAGISLVFSLGRLLQESGRSGALVRVIRRSVLLYLIGIVYYGGISQGVEHIRLMGVLQRIALAYFFTGLLFCFFRWRGLVAACAALLLGYWALMALVPAPGIGAGHYAEGQNLANYVDAQYLPFRKWDGDHDPEGLLSTLPAIGTCILGALAGLFITNRRYSEERKVAYLLGAGIAGVALGFLWGLEFPVIKKIWTSSYVLVAAGYSCIFLALFHYLIEVKQYQRWAMPFVWIGMNPITLYVAFAIVKFPELAERLVGGPVKAALGQYGEVLVTAVALGLVFALANFLYRKKVFIRI